MELSEKSLLFIEKAKKVHGDKYDYSLVDYKNNKTKVKIICKEHGVFEQRPKPHIYQQQGCPWCAKNISNKDNFIKKAIFIHGDRYDYSLIDYKNNKIKVKIICNEHGIFEISPSNHLLRKGCPKCAGRYKTAIEVINEFKSIHGDRYDYSLVDYKNKRIKVKIICKKHGVFEISPTSHLLHIGCPKCAGKNKTTKEVIENLKMVHGDKYDYSLIDFKNCYVKLKIICKKHGEFSMRYNDHLNGCGCPKCNESHGERKISKILDKFNIKYIREFKLEKSSRSLRLDFFIPEFNIGIEYNGNQHYEIVENFGGEPTFLKTIERDERKKKICEEKNIKLLIIPYTINKIEDIKQEIIKFLEKEKVSY